ncbi:MAG: hypothetical protein ACH36H_03850 [Candidatus Nanopelagicales bacterium]
MSPSPHVTHPRAAAPKGTSTTLAAPTLRVERLTVRRGQESILGPETFTLTGPAVALLTGPDPAARMALAGVLTGTLPAERFTSTGTVEVNGRTSPPLVRAATALAQPWRVRSAADEPSRRLASLAWAARTGADVIVMCPGLDGLTGTHQRDVLAASRRLAQDGRLVVLTSAAAGITGEALSAADVTILLTAASAR